MYVLYAVLCYAVQSSQSSGRGRISLSSPPPLLQHPAITASM